MTAERASFPSVSAAHWWLALKGSGLPGAAILIGFRLLDSTDGDATVVELPTPGPLASAAKLPRWTVKNALSVLYVAGWLALCSAVREGACESHPPPTARLLAGSRPPPAHLKRPSL
jgi:hypothetical protein